MSLRILKKELDVNTYYRGFFGVVISAFPSVFFDKFYPSTFLIMATAITFVLTYLEDNFLTIAYNIFVSVVILVLIIFIDRLKFLLNGQN